MGTDIFIDDSEEPVVDEDAVVEDQSEDAVEEITEEADDAVIEEASENGGEELSGKSAATDGDEPEEILPMEFLENPELCSGVLPPEALGGGINLLETTIISPEQRKSGMSLKPRAPKLSSRRTAAASSGGSRRSQKINLDDLSPEELAQMKKNDRKAKFMIYAVLGVLFLAFLALFTYKLPALPGIGDRFPNGVWPWNKILPQYTDPQYNNADDTDDYGE